MGRYQPPAETEQIAATLKRAAAALHAAEIPFALAGSVACWARGGPAPSNDLDFAISEQDAEPALQALESVGMRGDRPPEGWLLKAYDGDVMVDLIWDFEGLGETEEVIGRADESSVEGVEMLVLNLQDVFVSRLCAMTEHHLDFANPLAAARALREQVDWHEVRARTACSPYAIGFLAMLEALDIIPPEQAGATPSTPTRQSQHHARVRVVGRA
jgi:hypothetical protein